MIKFSDKACRGRKGQEKKEPEECSDIDGETEEWDILASSGSVWANESRTRASCLLVAQVMGYLQQDKCFTAI